ncbi:MAG: ParB/RepB/Spo0J family partition protein [Chloroflexia bacterium]
MSTKKRGGLGRGLGALIPTTVPDVYIEPLAVEIEPSMVPFEAEAAVVEEFIVIRPTGLLHVAVEAISPNPHQPRQTINQDKLEELANSIREHGIIQPIVVTSQGNSRYSLIAGERRWRAAQLAGLAEVPVVIKEATTGEQLQLALVENIQRADLHPLEAAYAYKSLIDDFGLTQEAVADRVGKNRITITNALRLLRLPEQVLQSLSLDMITEGHARALLMVPDEERMLRLLEHTVAEGLNVRQVEALARRLAQMPVHESELPQSPQTPDLYNAVRVLEDRFRDALGTKVQLSKSSRGGKLVIYFYSDEELDRIYGTIVGDDE